MQNPQAIAALRLVEDVRREQDGDPLLRPQVFQVVRKVAAGAGIEPRGRLIQQEEVRVVHERLGQFDATLQTAGERLHPLLGSFRQPQPGQEGVRPLPQRSSLHSVEMPVVPQVLHHGELGVEARALKDHPQVPSHVAGLARQIVAEHGHAPRGHAKQCGENLEERRLPAPVRPEQPEDLPARDGEGDVRERGAIAVPMTEAVDQHGRAVEPTLFETRLLHNLLHAYPSLAPRRPAARARRIASTPGSRG